jgi:hypothetical protein
MLSFQKLDVYRCAVDMVAFSASISGRVQKASRALPSSAIELASRVVAMLTKLCR